VAFGFRFGGSQSPIEKLASGKLKDEEKQQLLQGLVQANPPAVELIPLLTVEDTAVVSRAAQLFLARVDGEAVTALLEDLLERTSGTANGLKVLQKCREELLKSTFDAQLAKPPPHLARKLWEFALDLPATVSDGYLERAIQEAPGAPRLTALRRVIKTKGVAALRPLLLECASNREASVRKEALNHLGGLEGDDIFAVMLDRLGNDDSKEIRDFAGKYLQQFITRAPPEVRPRVLGRLLLAGDPEQRTQLVKSMFGMGRPEELLVGVLQFCKTLTGVQHRTVMEALTAVGDSLIQPTLGQLSASDADLRVQAVYLLEAFADVRTVGPLLNMLRDGDWWVRIVVCETLGRLKEPMIITSLKELFTDSDAKWAAIESVGRIGGEPAASALLPLLKDASAEVRGAVVMTLKQVKDVRVQPALNEVSHSDASIDVRLKAVEVLRSMQGDVRPGSMVVSSKELTKPLEKMLAYTRERNGSDLHITPGEPPILRVNGVIERVQSPKIEQEHTTKMLVDVLDPVRKPTFEKTGAVDLCYQIPGVGRFRTNLFKMKRGMAGTFRCVPNHPPSFEDLGLPRHLADIGTYHQGIVLVTGPAGAGKSTTLTALVNLINETRPAHVLTFEDPVEFVHLPKKALINQREIGRDSATYASAMRGALREDPDVIVVGDMRDPETVRLALLASETGHLVVATMQTTGAAATIDKLVDAFPPEEQHQVRGGLAESLKLIVSQVLVPRADGKGRMAVFEILKSTSSVRSLIRDGKTLQLPSTMMIGRSVGMQTLDGALEERLRAGHITFETALHFAQSKDAFAKLRNVTATPAVPPVAAAPAAAQRPPARPGTTPAPPGPAAARPGPPARPGTTPAPPGRPGAPVPPGPMKKS
jgi:twitching motility protein PilT